MAIKPKVRTGVGMLATPPPLRLTKEGTLPVTAIVSINQTLAGIVKHINNGLSFGSGVNGEQPGGLDAQTLSFTAPSGANTEFEVPHGLRRTPWGFFPAFINLGGVIYASNYGSWNKERVLLKCSAASADCIIIVF